MRTFQENNKFIPLNLKILPWIVCFSAALFFFYEFIQMNMFNTISNDLMQDYQINATNLGKLSAYYFYANLIFLPVAGNLLDRFSTRKIVLFALLLCVLGIGGFAFTHSLTLTKFFRFISGIGSAFCFLSSIRLASRWFSPHRMALITGLIVTMAMIGGMVAQTPLTLLTEYLGWRHALICDAGLGVLILIIIACFVSDYPPQQADGQNTYKKEISDLKLRTAWRLAYLNPQNWLCGIYTCLMNLPIALLGAIWGSLFLQNVSHFSAADASFATSLLFLGTILGGPVLGWFSDKLSKRRLPMVLGVIISFFLVLLIIYPPFSSFFFTLFLFFALGVSTSAQIISYPLVAENNPKSLTATAVSVVSFLTIGGYAVFQPLFGWLMDLGEKTTEVTLHSLPAYNAGDFHKALLILPIAFMIAFLSVLFMKEKKTSS